MEVEGVVVKDYVVWNSASVAAHAMLRCMSQKDEATIVSQEYFFRNMRPPAHTHPLSGKPPAKQKVRKAQEYFNAGCCDVRNLNLSASFARL
jgi:hypothetical protein